MAEELKRVWATARLRGEPYDVVLHESLDAALDYIHDNLAEHIGCRFSEAELIKEGWGCSRLLWSEEMDAESYDAVFNHGEELDRPTPVDAPQRRFGPDDGEGEAGDLRRGGP